MILNWRLVSKILLFAIVLSGLAFLYWFVFPNLGKTRGTIKVGILHSLTGTMATSEQSVVNATLMAIDEINQKGGLLGKKIVPIIRDGQSKADFFALEAQKLITQEKVDVVFGCWTSASRKAVKPVFEKENHLLFYPLQYEGLEDSPNIIYTGAAPNQQLIPAVKWCFDNFGKKFFLVGSDYIYPRTANEIIKLQLKSLKGEIVGEEYQPLGGSNFEEIVNKIELAKPDVIINTINGDSNIAFFIAMHNESDKEKESILTNIPIMSTSIGEIQLAEYRKNLSIYVEKLAVDRNNPDFNLEETAEHIWNEHIVGSYACWNYFQTIDTERNLHFVEAYKNKYGEDQVTSDPMEAGYFGVYLWAQAVVDADTSEVNAVRPRIKRQSFNAPEGVIYLDDNLHTWKTVRIGQVQENGQFSILWTSDGPVMPLPFPIFKSKEAWDLFLQNLYEGWHQNWAAPEAKP